VATVNERLFNAEVRHAVSLQRFANGAVQRMVGLLNEVDTDLLARLSAAIEGTASDLRIERLEALLVDANALNATSYDRLSRALSVELHDFLDHELEYQATLLETEVPEPIVTQLGVNRVVADQVFAAAMARPFQGVLLSEALEDQEAGRAKLIRDTIRMGIIEGRTEAEITRTLRGTRAQGYADGLLERPRHQLAALVRTAVNHTQNYAKQKIYEENKDLVPRWVFRATLDSRTSITCGSLDGKTFPVGKGPQPPRHWNCRSLAAPITASWRELGVNLEEVDAGMRASMDGQVPAATSFGGWLRDQPAAVQDEVLGAKRGQLFREHHLPLDKFVNKQGEVLDLEALKRRDETLFNK
jgi:SPP1 gp7 family putative phage head morphogenesis protein